MYDQLLNEMDQLRMFIVSNEPDIVDVHRSHSERTGVMIRLSG